MKINFKPFLTLSTPPTLINNKILNLKRTLFNGQCFIWSQDSTDSSIFSGVVGKTCIFLKENEKNQIMFFEYPENPKIMEILNEYFQTNLDLESLITFWSKKNDLNSKIFNNLIGMRIIRQDPVECFFSFLMSQNNNITRITQIVQKIKKNYGTHIINDFYSFPDLDRLCQISETELRDLGLGYRAKYLVETASQIKKNGGSDWLLSLRSKNEEEVREQLMAFTGVGRKVADCISLFSLDKKECVPIDTHIYQIYQKREGGKISKNLGKKDYEKISQYFKEMFGDYYAGWGHSFLFANEIDPMKKLKKKRAENSETKDLEVLEKNKRVKN